MGESGILIPPPWTKKYKHHIVNLITTLDFTQQIAHQFPLQKAERFFTLTLILHPI